MNYEIPTLDEAGKVRWQQALRELQRTQGWDKDIALMRRMLEHREVDGSDANLCSEYSRFRSGDPTLLKSWLVRKRKERLEPLALALGIEPTRILALLEQAARPAQPQDQPPWHQAFPRVRVGQLRVAPRWRGARWTDERGLAQVAGELQELLKQGKPCWRWILGPVGTGRRTAARLLHEELGRLCVEPKCAVRLLLDEPAEGWVAAQASETPTLAVAVALPQELQSSPDERLVPAEWGTAQLRELIDGLASLGELEGDSLQRCRDLLQRAEQEPVWLDGVRNPAALIRLLGDVARQSQPLTTLADQRRLRGAAVWRRAQACAAELAPFDQRLAERFWAGALLRSGPGGGWTRLSRVEAIELLEAAARSLVRPDVSQPEVAELTTRLAQEKSPKARQTLAQELQRKLAVRRGDLLLAAMEQAQLVHLDPARDQVEAVDGELVTLWAARGLVDDPARLRLEPCWARLADPGWAALVQELALAGFPLARFLDALAAAPAWLAVDRARSFVLFAAAGPTAWPEPLVRDVLVPAWIAALWAQVQAPFEVQVDLPSEVQATDEYARLQRALPALSLRYLGLLPELDVLAPTRSLAALLPAELIALQTFWREPVEAAANDGPVLAFPGGCWWLHEWAGDAPDWLLRRLAPGQCLVLSCADWEGLRGRSLPGEAWPWGAVAHAAEHGDPRAQTLLAGRRVRWVPADDDEPPWPLPDGRLFDWRPEQPEELWLWRAIPADQRLAWLARLPPADEQDWLRLHEIVRTRWTDWLLPDGQDRMEDALALRHPDGLRAARLAELLQRFPTAAVDRLLHTMADPRSPGWYERRERQPLAAALIRTPGAVLELAERLGREAVLEQLVTAPARWLEGCRLLPDAQAGLALVAPGREAGSARWVVRAQLPADPAHKQQSEELRALLRELLVWVEVGEQAAVALARRGRTAALRQQWQQGAAWALSAELQQDSWRFIMLRNASFHLPGIQQRQAEIPRAACERTLARWQDAVRLGPPGGSLIGGGWGGPWRQLGDSSLAEAPERLRRGEMVPMELTLALPDHPDHRTSWNQWLAEADPAVRTGLAVIWALRRLDPSALVPEPVVEDEIVAWLERQNGTSGLRLPEGDLILGTAAERQAGAGMRAGRALLELGDDEPVRWWLDQPEESLRSREDQARWQLVSSTLEQDRNWLDRTWSLEVADERRGLLLLLGAPSRLTRADEPARAMRPWWVAGVLGQPSGIRARLVLNHAAHPETVPLLRALAQQARLAGHHREAACWAVRLHRHEPWAPELIEALQHWLRDDPAPLSGAAQFQLWGMPRWDAPPGHAQEPIVCAGGWGRLLELTRRYSREQPAAPWLRAGAIRLWDLVVQTGFSPDHTVGSAPPARAPDQDDDDDDDDPVSLADDPVLASLADSLLGWLAELGEHTRIGADLAPALPQHWIVPWLPLAPAPQLHALLHQDGELRLRIMGELARRNDQGLVGWALAQVDDLTWDETDQQWRPQSPETLFELLGRVAPARLPDQAEALLRRLPAHRRELLRALSLQAWGPAAPELRVLLRRASLGAREPE